MPLEVELCAVPHLKGLINSYNIIGQQECGSTITLQKMYVKIPILLHTDQMLYSISASSVKLKNLQKSSKREKNSIFF